jgi:hypothetical protein
MVEELCPIYLVVAVLRLLRLPRPVEKMGHAGYICCCLATKGPPSYDLDARVQNYEEMSGG